MANTKQMALTETTWERKIKHKKHILFYITYIHPKLELNTCSFRACYPMTHNRWSWNKPKSHYLSFEVNNIDYVKPLILTFLWVIFDINHLLQTGLHSERPPLPSPLFFTVHGCKHASS